MRIAINGLSARFGGGVAYLSNLLQNLAEIDRENQYTVFASPEKRDSFEINAPNFCIVCPRFPGRARIRRAFWEQLVLPFMIKRRGIDVLFSPGGIAPIIRTCKQVNLAQNMAPFSDELLESCPIGGRKLRFLILRKLYPFFAARSDANIFISSDSLKKMQRFGKINIDRSKVIYHGRNEIFKPVPPDAAAGFVQKEYGIGGNYILYVSNITRYKEQLEVVRAFRILRDRGIDVGKLVFAGILVEPRYYREIMALADELGIADDVVYLGQVPQDHLPYLYSAASAFVFASICENCPNILIEAMACGAPIASSEIEPMPEICGNAALYFDPHNPADIADKIARILSDEAVREGLISNARKNVERFCWKETAIRTLEVLKTCR